MNLENIQKNKEKAFKYLISKGFVLKHKLIKKEDVEGELNYFIHSKKVNKFTLYDKKGNVVDEIFAEYLACETEWEATWTVLSS